MRNILTIFLLLIFATGFCQSKENASLKEKLNKLENQISELENKNFEEEIITLKERLNFQKNINEQLIASISSQFDSATYSLAIFGFLFTVFSIILGVYVTNIERKIVRIGMENEVLLSKNQKIKEDVQDLNKLIQEDIYNLFLKIKREETVHILDRLVKVPKDISNLRETLFSRELEKEDFTKLRKAYFSFDNEWDEYNYSYHLLFFQHFLEEALRDKELRNYILNDIPSAIKNSFENDILSSTYSFITVIVDKGIQEFNLEINQFFKGLTTSEHKNLEEIYKLLFDNLKTRKNRFEMFNVIKSSEENRQAKIEFGNLLVSKYIDDNPTESENLVFNELNELIKAKEKETSENDLSVKDSK